MEFVTATGNKRNDMTGNSRNGTFLTSVQSGNKAVQQGDTYHGLHAEHVAVVAFTGVVLGDVREVCEVVSVLARTVNVANLVPTHQFLGTTRHTSRDALPAR
jgi:hypothetical protein